MVEKSPTHWWMVEISVERRWIIESSSWIFELSKFNRQSINGGKFNQKSMNGQKFIKRLKIEDGQKFHLKSTAVEILFTMDMWSKTNSRLIKGRTFIKYLWMIEVSIKNRRMVESFIENQWMVENYTKNRRMVESLLTIDNWSKIYYKSM